MPTIDGTLRATARRVPDAEALSFGDAEYNYAELDHVVDRVAASLSALGLSKGDRLVLLSRNSDRFIIAFYATLRLGAMVVPINFSSSPEEIEYLLSDSGGKFLVFDPALLDPVDAVVTSGLPESCERVMALSETEEYLDLSAFAESCTDPVPRVEVDESDDAVILYTSGTTGRPKGALFDHHRLMWASVNVLAVYGMRAEDRLLHVAPLFHAADLCVMLIPGTTVAAKHVVLDSFDPRLAVDIMESERVTMFFGVPTMFQALLNLPDLAERDLSAWRTGLFGAAPMPASVVEQLLSTLPDVELMQVCGQTEGGPGGIYSTAEQVKKRPDASGFQAVLLAEARVVHPDGEDVAPGEIGELIVRGETIMKGYWNDPAATAETLVDGWLHTDDLVLLDSDGSMTLMDRIKDMIISDGHNVYSVEVEKALAAHPAIEDCAVIARPHAERGESIVAIVKPVEGSTITLDDVKSFCRDRLADYKVPQELVIGSVPRNPSGKIMKHDLRSEITAVG